MKAKFLHEGKAIDITAGASGIAAGDIVVSGGIVGVASNDIPANGTGAIAIEGVYSIVKKTDAVLTIGADVYWNATSAYAMGSSAGLTKIGKAVEAAASGATVVKVKIG